MDEIKIENIFQGLPEKPTKNEIFETLLENNSLKIQRIISTGQTTPEGEWYDQVTDEWVILLQGCAVLTFENAADIKLNPGDHLLIKAHKKHRVSWVNPDETCIWLALHIQPL